MTDADAIKLGRRGGSANTPKQRATRRLNAYLTLAQRFPNSIKVKQELARLKKEASQ